MISKNIIKIIKKTKFKFNEIYIYCAAIHGVATLNILQKNQYKVISLIDDNLDIEKQTLVNVDIIKGNSFFKIKRQKRSKKLVLVCQQTAEIFDNIVKKLKMNGVKNNQIINIKY